MVIGGLVEKELLRQAELLCADGKGSREKEFEWLRDQLLNMAPHTRGTVLPNNTEAKKPNIYLYPETETEITPIERKGFTVVEWGGAVLDLQPH